MFNNDFLLKAFFEPSDARKAYLHIAQSIICALWNAVSLYSVVVGQGSRDPKNTLPKIKEGYQRLK